MTTPIPDSGAVAESGAPTYACESAKSSESLRARSPVMSDIVSAKAEAVFASDLFSRFSNLCGGCHVQQADGDFKVNAGNFKTMIEEGDIPPLARMKSDDPDEYMPPPPSGVPFSQRPESDPIREFAKDVEQWIAAGKPPIFYIDPEPLPNGTSQYLLSKEVGTTMTNIGNCIPDRQIVGIEKEEMQRLDEMFANVKTYRDLPKTLDGTDITTFDAEKLARYGVIGFAPGYPLFSDHAKKIRVVRTPLDADGKLTPIRFNPDTKEFEIPPNTRFYKTFLKHVIDEDGNEAYRKIETRLVLSRPDSIAGADAGAAAGTTKVNAIFATWRWSKDETHADLVNIAYNDGTGFQDTTFTYDVDEQKANAIRNDPKIKPAAQEFQLRDQGLVRTYAIPGSDRCVQCHMGSPARAGILGFTPLQIDRRETGKGGTYEPSGPDELGQLQRLIDYGVIAGMNGPGDVSLETSQATPPRNDQELNAQAYMVGNCGFCHNPRGYPTVQNPELLPLLNFWPTGGGGIFHFPLDRTSPRIQRGDHLDTPIPYITPSLVDLPRSNPTKAMQNADHDLIETGGTNPNWYSAPWRSLIYRNVETPFPYVDDGAIFPHMPMNVPGFDCRAPRIMAEWMVSIPAKWKHADYNASVNLDVTKPLYVENCPSTLPFTANIGETPYCGGRGVYDEFARLVRTVANLADDSPQPYVEVMPGDKEYDQAVVVAKSRLAYYQSEERFKYYCPDEQSKADIVDTTIPQHPNDPVPQDGAWFWLQDGKQEYQWVADGVPDRPHFVITDTTQPLSLTWSPRRSDWKKVLIDGDIGAAPTDPLDYDGIAKYQSLRAVVDLLDGKNANPPRLTSKLRTFARTPRPMGRWTTPPGCQFDDAKQPKASAVKPAPAWFAAASVPGDARIYMQSPGSFIFTQICANCHGRLGDSHGRLASKILEMSGGSARVANFREGLFGPVNDPGKNRADAFGTDAATGGDSFNDVDDLASRYMAFMGLGGTEKKIPLGLLTVVSLTPVFGATRVGVPVTDPNMLSTAKILCAETLPFRNASEQPTFNIATAAFDVGIGGSLQYGNGDAELWLELCSFDNPSPVRLIPFDAKASGGSVPFRPTSGTPFLKRSSFGAADLVGDHLGKIQTGLTDANLRPWCMDVSDADLAAAQTWWAKERKDGQPLPRCPANRVPWDAGAAGDGPDRTEWINRAAANAGFSVFAYLDEMTRGRVDPSQPYNACPTN